jgi:hypothetical protein
MDNFTQEQQQRIRETWRSNPPPQCTGNCELKELHLECVCTACGWCDDGAVPGGLIDNDFTI